MERIRIICFGSTIFAIALLGFGALVADMEGDFPKVLIISGLVVFFAGQIYQAIRWRCPDCHKMLPSFGIFQITICPYCGCHLDK